MALLAVEELRADYGAALPHMPALGDPQGVGERYIALTRRYGGRGRLPAHLVIVTSQARKDVIPVVEKHNVIL